MSYVSIYKIHSDGDVVSFAEGSNNHVFAPIIWEVLGKKYHYLNEEKHPYLFVDPGLQELWKKWPDPKMSKLEQILLGSTFDRMWCKRETLPLLIEACEGFLNEHVRKPHGKHRNFKTGQMEDAYYDSRALAGDPEEMVGLDGKLMKVDPKYRRQGIISALKEIYEDPTARGAAFNCCSATTSFWHVQDVPHVGENEDGSIKHTKDSDCTLTADGDECEVCGVWHSTPCEDCGASAFHKEDCAQYEWESRPWNIDKDTEQPRGEFQGKKAWELTAEWERGLAEQADGRPQAQ